MQFQVKSTKIRKTLTFIREENHLITVDARDRARQNICASGRLTGEQLVYTGDDIVEFQKICRTWLNYYLRKVA